MPGIYNPDVDLPTEAPRLSTARLTLRGWVRDDAVIHLSILTDPSVIEFNGPDHDIPRTFDRDIGAWETGFRAR